jgi:hypothetical protein
MDDAQHRAGDADIISFAGQNISFHTVVQKYDVAGISIHF